MAVRRWQVYPDVALATQDGELPCVSRQAIDAAMLDGASLLDRAGGVFTAIVGRSPTDLPGEMVTTGVVCEWKDRTDTKAQPEQQQDVLPQRPPPDQPRLTAEEWAAAQDIQDAADAESEEAAQEVQDAAQEAGAAALRASPDGLDYSQLEDEDLAEIPEGAR
jgi:hypothetical protein